MRLLLMMILTEGSSALCSRLPVHHACGPAVCCSHHPPLLMSAAPDNGEVVIPDKFPTFGLSPRQQLRLSNMQTRGEPLIQEIFGLQVVLGALGSQTHGMLGFVLGFFQVSASPSPSRSSTQFLRSRSPLVSYRLRPS